MLGFVHLPPVLAAACLCHQQLFSGLTKLTFLGGLRQVVSEVLFPSPVSSSPAQRSPVSPGPPAGLSPAPPRPSGRPHDTQNSVEVIAQLLQEAEGELRACVLHEQLAFITHDRYFPFCLFRFRWKGF